MDIGKRFGTSKALENEGVWHELGDGAAIKVARWNNRRFAELKRQLERKYRAQQKGGVLPEKVAEQVIIETIAHAILVDWRGLEINGQPLPAYTPEEAVRVLTDTETVNMGEFRDLVAGVSMDMNNFRLEREAEAAKNSPASSAGG
jgi:hypothetical protein